METAWPLPGMTFYETLKKTPWELIYKLLTCDQYRGLQILPPNLRCRISPKFITDLNPCHQCIGFLIRTLKIFSFIRTAYHSPVKIPYQSSVYFWDPMKPPPPSLPRALFNFTYFQLSKLNSICAEITTTATTISRSLLGYTSPPKIWLVLLVLQLLLLLPLLIIMVVDYA